jgi:hypothetical protein
MGLVIGTAKMVKGRGWRGAATASEMLDRLGVKRLPDEGMPERVIDGVRVYVAPKPEPVYFSSGRRRHMSRVRVMAICECGKHVAVGRLNQHKCKVS